MNVQFITGVAIVAEDPAASRRLFVDALGLPLDADQGGEYFHSERIGGAKHFAIWPLAQAARACFGADEWPAGRPVRALPRTVGSARRQAGVAAGLAAGPRREKGPRPTRTRPR